MKAHLYDDNTGTSISTNSNIFIMKNYPNPFTNNTTISFYNTENQNVKLYIYDINGKIIQVLLNTQLNEGKFSVDFNSEAVTSGIYFCTLKTKNGGITKKLIKI